jgi:hypothetical protein
MGLNVSRTGAIVNLKVDNWRIGALAHETGIGVAVRGSVATVWARRGLPVRNRESDRKISKFETKQGLVDKP